MIDVEHGIYDFAHKTADPREDALLRHMHNGYELLYLQRGDAEYVVEGSIYRLTPRTLLLVRPRRYHYLRALAGKTFDRFVIHFPAERVPEALRAYLDEAPEIEDAENASDEKIEGHVVLKDVTFGYVPEKTVLKNISLYAKPGQKIALAALLHYFE